MREGKGGESERVRGKEVRARGLWVRASKRGIESGVLYCFRMGRLLVLVPE